MLRIAFTTILLTFSLSAFACWKIQGSLAVDGKVWKINQKINHGKKYAFPMDSFVYNMTVRKGEGKNHIVAYKLEEKKGVKLELITSGEDEIEVGKQKDIFAKGERGQPNTIITLKLEDI